MTNEQILEKQVEALEKLLQLRSAIIEELEQKVSTLQNEVAKQNAYPWPGGVGISTPWVGPAIQQPYGGWGGAGGGGYSGGGSSIIISSTCPDGSLHQYPSMWGGAGSPVCTKCGQNQGAITSASTSGYITPVHTTGLVQAQSLDGISITGQQCTTDNVFTLTNVAK